ncbi:bombyxin E-1-like [Amphibalanus amphitrite]|uniref:bombyxin E-1-like n=1 Tax=Amphibalanus amphitrite TaxID=1232801 RepID=UPI001C91C64E|nr:bombyxin E-1-like [Amphibalanus amphitrite]
MTSSMSVLPLVLLVAAVVHGDTQEGQNISKRSAHLCGKHLVETLSSVCGWNVGKRAAVAAGFLPEEPLYGRLSDSRWLELPSGDVVPSADMTSVRQRVLQNLFTPHSQERRLFAGGIRNKRSIVDECCDTPCDLKTLSMYC